MSYHWSQKTLHWLIALLVIAQIPVGVIIAGYESAMVKMVDSALGKGGFNLIYDLHKSVGLTILGLMILRVVARATLGAPDYRPPLALLERLMSRLVHGFLYLLLLVTPIVGWLGVSLYPAPAPWFFLFNARLPLEKNRAVSEFLLQDVHGPLGLLIAILALAHVAAAFKHWLVNRDAVMQRMTR